MSDEIPAPAVDETAQESDGLGDAGKAALKAERDRANTAEKAFKALQTQHDEVAARATALEAAQQQYTAELAARELAITRLNVALDKGLPKELAGRLQGDDEAALAADADQLKQLFATPATSTSPRPDPSQGAKAPAASTPEAQFAAFMGPLLNP